MQNYLWVALGSALGGVGRFWCSGVAVRLLGDGFPWGTLFVNVIGSALIGFFATLAGPDGRWLLPADVRQFITVGVLGGFTTFSAFSLQTLAMMRDGEWMMALVNVFGSVLLCLLGVWLGHLLAMHLGGLDGG